MPMLQARNTCDYVLIARGEGLLAIRKLCQYGLLEVCNGNSDGV